MSSARFRSCLAITLKHEGGFTEGAGDPGGATNLGISLRYARSLGSMLDLDGDGDVDRDDIVKVTFETATVIYKNWFWKDVRGDELPPGIDLVVFDYAVNSGPGRSIKALQKVLGIQQDGVFGPQTLATVKKADPLEVITSLNNERLAFMRGLAIWPRFKNGWLARVDDIWHEAAKMVGGPVATMSEAASTGTGGTATMLTFVGAVATAGSQLQPVVAMLGPLAPWVVVAALVCGLVAIIVWRTKKPVAA